MNCHFCVQPPLLLSWAIEENNVNLQLQLVSCLHWRVENCVHFFDLVCRTTVFGVCNALTVLIKPFPVFNVCFRLAWNVCVILCSQGWAFRRVKVQPCYPTAWKAPDNRYQWLNNSCKTAIALDQIHCDYSWVDWLRVMLHTRLHARMNQEFAACVHQYQRFLAVFLPRMVFHASPAWSFCRTLACLPSELSLCAIIKGPSQKWEGEHLSRAVYISSAVQILPVALWGWVSSMISHIERTPLWP